MFRPIGPDAPPARGESLHGLARGLAVAVVVFVACTVLKVAVRESVADATPFSLYLLAVLAAAWAGGLPAGVIATVAAAALGHLVFFPDGLDAAPEHEAVRLALFVVEGLAIAMVTARLRTERRRAAVAVGEARAAAAKLDGILASVDEGIVVQDARGRLIYANDPAARVLGYDGPAALLAASTIAVADHFTVLTEDGAPLPLDELPGRIVLRGGPGTERLIRFRSHAADDRDDRFSLVRANPIVAADGAVAGVVSSFRDVSAERLDERRRGFLARAAAELTSSLDYETTLATCVRLAVPTIADWCAIDMVDGDRTRRLAVAHVDPAKIEFVTEVERRYPPDPRAASGTPNIVRTGLAEMIPTIPAAMIEAGARDAEHLRLIRELALHSYIGVPIKRGERTIGVITFVTAESRRTYGAADLELARALAERAAIAVENARLYAEAEQARLAAAAERDRLEALIMAAPSAVAVLRAPDLVFDMMNEPYRRLVPSAAVGGSAHQLALAPGTLARLIDTIATGQPLTGVESPYTRVVDGAPVTVYTTYTVQPLRDAAGAVDRLVFFVHDVTDQVLARQRVEATRAEAELANRSKDEFLAMLGHELRNPLAPILTALQLMNLRAGDAFAHERRVIDRQLKHMVRLVDDLLDVSRITRGTVLLERERIELAAIVGDAIEMASPLLEQGRHQLEVDVARTGLPVWADRQRLAQVVANLLTNAAKYTPSGGRIEVIGARHGDRIELRVRDNGVGIAADMLPRVFDMFVQQQQAIDRSRGGLGLGLTIVKNLVTLHDGEVTAHSDGPGRGTEVVVTLAAAAAAEPVVAVPVDAASGPHLAGPGPIRVLIVDDNEDAADLLSMVLEARGYLTRVAHDGPAALRIVDEFVPQTALLDIGLPVMDGFELARRLRANPAMSGLRLIALTGYGQDSDFEQSRAAGFDFHLVKPIEVRQVVELLR